MRINLNKEYQLNTNDHLWRYIDLHQLLYFLNNESIFFAPLSSFEDPLEGMSRQWLSKQSESPGSDKQNFDHHELRKDQEYLFASCWFLGDTESMAMWETHSNPDSVAIEFNAKKLIDLVLTSAKKFKPEDFDDLSYGKVDYIKLSPVNHQELDEQPHKSPGFLKDKSYQHEQEFRFIVMQSDRSKREFWGFDLPVGSLKDHDFRIITHPKMEKWKHENLQIVLRNFELEKKLRRSDVVVKS